MIRKVPADRVKCAEGPVGWHGDGHVAWPRAAPQPITQIIRSEHSHPGKFLYLLYGI